MHTMPSESAVQTSRISESSEGVEKEEEEEDDEEEARCGAVGRKQMQVMGAAWPCRRPRKSLDSVN